MPQAIVNLYQLPAERVMLILLVGGADACVGAGAGCVGSVCRMLVGCLACNWGLFLFYTRVQQ